MRYLDTLEPVYAKVGYGSVGLAGRLGYEDGHVRVGGARVGHALSTHPPARLIYDLGGAFSRLHSRVGLDDGVPAGRSYADFTVRADGRQVALVPGVWSGVEPVEISVDVAGAQLLELAVSTDRWDHCHAVWLEPRLEGVEQRAPVIVEDCLGRVAVEIPAVKPTAARCIATIASAGYGPLLDDMLGSLYANGDCGDALVVVIALDADAAVDAVVAKYGATPIRGTARGPLSVATKSLLYSIAQLVDAERFICLDADLLVLGSLEPLFAAAEISPGAVFAASEANDHGFDDVDHMVQTAYGGGDIAAICGEDVGAYRLVVNDGVFAGSRAALLAVDATIRGMPGAVAWCAAAQIVPWRNQAIFNFALAQLGCGVELAPTWNVQLHTGDVDVELGAIAPRVTWQARPVRVLHLNGVGREKLPALRGVYARVPDPLPVAHGDAYATFVRVLRTWVGRRGLSALGWSFYGTPAGYACVRDPGAFPLFGLLHYLVRSSGCVRVLETGTAFGVSAACLASAVAHRAGGRVVTVDTQERSERRGLWNALPAPMRDAIEARHGDSLAEMRAALAAGESYHAALLDSLHEGEHVWAEFKLAARLVAPGGLILVHDPGLADGTVPAALARIREAGYEVTTLWAGEGTVPEDEGLQLALIENRRS